MVRLSDTDLTLSEDATDVRRHNVSGRDGNELKHVDDLLIDDQEHKVRFL